VRERGRVRGRRAPGSLLIFGCVVVLALTLAACGDATTGDGEDFPSEQIELIVPFEAGGGTDQTARQLASAAEQTCETDVIVSNQEGSAGAEGHQAGANAQPDGYTVVVATAEIAMIEHLGLAEITPEDITGVMQYNFDPAALSVSEDSPYETIDDFISAAEAGENLSIGTSGTGGIWHVSFAGMAEEAGVEFTNVPFDGAAPAIQAVLGGQVDATSASGAEVAPQVESGELRPLAVMGEERIDILPDTPTLQEEGIDWTSGTWRGLGVPTETPDEVVQTLNDCFEEAAQSEEFQEFMENNGFGMEITSADEFDQFMDDEYERFGEIIESVNIQPE
jgi:tripartite-type tricarboxylate transporter receptor subunit TctC